MPRDLQLSFPPSAEPPSTDDEARLLAVAARKLRVSPDSLMTARPTRIYFIDREGRVAYNPGIGPFGFSPDHLEPVVRSYLGLS